MVNYVIGIYERGLNNMSKKKNNKRIKAQILSQETNVEKEEQKDEVETNKLRLFKIFEIVIVSIAIPFMGFIGKLLWDFHTDLAILNEKVASIQKDVEPIPNIETDIELLEEKNKSFKSDLNGYKNSISLKSSNVYVPTDKVSGLLYNATLNNEDLDFLSSPEWNNNDIIAKNPQNGRKYRPKDLKDKKILLPYTENGQDIFFYGQFNKYNHWDGNCIINVYKNGILQVIMEGEYSDGKLISYNRVTYGKNTNKVKVWSISERKVSGHINTGETYTYFKTKNKKANFTQNNVEPSDILSIIDFRDWLNTPLEGYYNGNTSNGRYNDETGNAYLIKYFKDGTTRTIYCGNFKNGMFNDHTENAWYVSIDKESEKYIYFKGGFTDNKLDETENHKRIDIDNKDIHKIIDDMQFNSPIVLRGDENGAI